MNRAGFAAALLANALRGAVLRQAKNAARLVLRRELHRRDNRALWQVLAHVCGLRRIDFVTHVEAPGEGVGSQALAMLAARALADGLGTSYAHTPFGKVNHALGDPQAFARSWEQCLNLAADARQAAGARGLDINAVFSSDLYDPRNQAMLFSAFAAMRPGLRARYRRPEGAPAKVRFTVALHVRRGDVTPIRNAHMWTPPEEIRSLAEDIVRVLSRQGISHDLLVVSQGTPADFPEMEGMGCTFVLDEDPLVSFARLVDADVLVLAKSSWSYLAALLSHGAIVAGDCGYPPQADWVPVRDSRIDETRFAACLEARRTS